MLDSKYSYKHQNILVILLCTCKVASGSPAITHGRSLIFFTNSEIKAWVWYWVLYRTSILKIITEFKNEVGIQVIKSSETSDEQW